MESFIDTLKNKLEGKTVTNVETVYDREAALCEITTSDGDALKIFANDLGRWMYTKPVIKPVYENLKDAMEDMENFWKYHIDDWLIFEVLDIQIENNMLNIIIGNTNAQMGNTDTQELFIIDLGKLNEKEQKLYRNTKAVKSFIETIGHRDYTNLSVT